MAAPQDLIQSICRGQINEVRRLITPCNLDEDQVAEAIYWATYHGQSQILGALLDCFPAFNPDTLSPVPLTAEIPLLLAIRFRFSHGILTIVNLTAFKNYLTEMPALMRSTALTRRHFLRHFSTRLTNASYRSC